MSKTVNVKATLKEHHHLQINKSNVSLDSLKKDIKKSFPLLNQEHVIIKLYWTDEDGDRVLLREEDLKQALIRVDGKLNLEIEADVMPHSISSQQSVLQAQQTYRTNLQSANGNLPYFTSSVNIGERSLHQNRSSTNIPQSPIEAAVQNARYPPEENGTQTSITDSLPYQCQDSQSSQESVVRQAESVVRQAMSESGPVLDQLDIPTDLGPIFDEWPSGETYALNLFKKMKKKLDDTCNHSSDRIYPTNSDKQCRVLCILNKDSGGKTVYKPGGIDMESTYLQQLKKALRWDLQIHKDKTSEERQTIHSTTVCIG